MKIRVTGCLLFRLTVLVTVLTSASQAIAQTDEAIFTLIGVGGGGNVQLANGQPVTNPADWSALANASIRTVPLPDGSTFVVTCTATLIGPGVLLTAAHCFDKGGSSGLSLGAAISTGGQMFKLNCDVSPEYSNAVRLNLSRSQLPRVPQDYAVCQFPMPDPAPNRLASVRFAVVDTKTPLSESDQVVMTGFGCTSIRIDADTGIVTGPSDKILRIGIAPVTGAFQSGASFDNSFVIILSAGKSRPILCPGDSGGPLLSAKLTAGMASPPYRVKGVNAHVTIRTTNGGYPILASAIAPLATDAFRTFLASWLKANPTRRVCGVNLPNRVPPCAD